MGDAGPEANLEPFPVQVGTVVPIRVDFEAFVAPEAAKPPMYHDPEDVGFRVNMKYRVDESEGMVIAEADVQFGDAPADEQGADEAKRPKPAYRLTVAAAASFAYDPQAMSKAEVETWCAKGAIYILTPYLRELVFSMTARSGFPAISMPLVTVPVFRKA